MLQMDVCDSQSVQQAVQAVVAEAGRIDVLINNAGIGIAGPLEEVDLKETQQVFDTNVFGVVRVCKAVLPYMRHQKSGRIFTISSIGSRVGLPYRSIYCSSKAAVDLITESLRPEARPFGIQVAGIHAGDIRTNINAHRIKSYRPDGPYAGPFERTYAMINREVEEGMPATEVAQKIARLIERPYLHPFYSVGKPLQRLSLVLKRVLPGSWFERLLKLYTG